MVETMISHGLDYDHELGFLIISFPFEGKYDRVLHHTEWGLWERVEPESSLNMGWTATIHYQAGQATNVGIQLSAFRDKIEEGRPWLHANLPQRKYDWVWYHILTFMPF